VKVDVPHIAIIGRPNVGKSTLYNRLIGKRKAITDPTPGVTRDALEAELEIGGKKFIIIDTGGLSTDVEGYGSIVTAKAISIAEKSDLILFVADVNQIDADDLEFMKKLRRFAKKIIFVANKVDTVGKENLVWNLFEYGFKNVIHVSAEHGRNIIRLKEEIEDFFIDIFKRPVIEPDSTGQSDPDIVSGANLRDNENTVKPIRITILGKPNTGKSTLTNLLLGEEKSIVSDQPGTTRDTIEGRFYFKNDLYDVIDTAGIRRKTRVIDSVEYYSVHRAIESIESSDVAFLLIDSVEDISDQDKKIAALVGKQGKGIIIVLSKWDKLEAIGNRLNAVIDRIRFLFPVLSYAPIIPISSHTGFGIEKLLKTAKTIVGQLETRIDTSKLNKLLKSWVEQFSVQVNGKPIKVNYGTQVSINPVRFLFFVNKKTGFRADYESYLTNKIRSNFSLDMIPISLDFKVKEKTDYKSKDK
jgi:GTP-binding protein